MPVSDSLVRSLRTSAPGRSATSQPDLFQSTDRPGYRPIEEIEPPPEDFIQRLRDELAATLALARGAPSLPWRDLTQAMLVEMRFHSIAETWLPADESAPLRAAFATEMERLYIIAETASLAQSEGTRGAGGANANGP